MATGCGSKMHRTAVPKVQVAERTSVAAVFRPRMLPQPLKMMPAPGKPMLAPSTKATPRASNMLRNATGKVRGVYSDMAAWTTFTATRMAAPIK
jgi:hypothetical protein